MVRKRRMDCAKTDQYNRYSCFTLVSEGDLKRVKKWIASCRDNNTDGKMDFLYYLRKAIARVKKGYWIATIEPVVDGRRIYYRKEQKPGVGYTAEQWAYMCKQYAPERGSRLASFDELIIWYALRIIDGFWTLDFVADDSSSGGNYADSPNALKAMAKTGQMGCGGYADGQGNTTKLVTFEDGYAIVGGDYSESGRDFPVAKSYYLGIANISVVNSVGVVVLTQ